MATSVSSSTFLSQYNDDYRDSDHYHRILFNNGRALQARELTQMQTIIQAEIGRIANYLFTPGTIFNASATVSSDLVKSTPYVVVQTLPDTPSILKGLKITGPDISGSNITATIKAVVPAASSPDGRNYLMLTYLSGANTTATNTTTGPAAFGSNQILTYTYGGSDFTLTTQLTNTAANPVTGFGSMIEVPSYATYAGGHVIFVEKQSLVIDPKDPTPSEEVGFVLNEQVITANDDISLFDNSGATPNITSPGADRLKITLTLTKKSDIGASDTFYSLYQFKDGVVVAENKSNSISGELGTRIRNERKSITGDYVVRNAKDQFRLEVAADSADNDYLVYKVGAGIAFVNGNKVERDEYRERVLKPRNTVDDVTTKTNEFVAASYGNYFLVHEDSAEGLVRHLSTHGQVNLKTGLVYTGTTIGTGRIRAIDKYNEYYRVHMFDVDMDSNGSGVEYNIGSVRSIGTSATNDWGNISPIEGEYRLVDKTLNSLLFPLPGGRVYDVGATSVSGAVSIVLSATASGGSASFTITAPAVFADPEQWIVQHNTNGTLYPAPTIAAGGSGSSSVTISGLTDGAVTLYAYEQRTLVRKSKTLNIGEVESGVTVSGGEFALSKADIYKFTSIVDDVTGDDVSYKFDLDFGQTDAYYDVGRGRLRTGQTQTNTVTVTYDYFSHSAGDYFCGKSSYANVEYEAIPYHVNAAGISYHLASVMDFRPRKNTSGTFSGGDAYIEPIPRNSDIVTIGTAKYWQPRIDVISLSATGKLTITKGDTSEVAVYPTNIPETDLVLHNISLHPYTMNDKDLKKETPNNLGYKMVDIRKLERRIKNLETFTTLNAAEIRNLNVKVGDPSGSFDRSNLGMTADPFSSNAQSDVKSTDFRAAIGGYRYMTAMQVARDVLLRFDSAASTGIVLKGSTIWPEYDEEVMITQDIASAYTALSEFDLSRTVGTGVIYPSSDNWTLRKKVGGTPESGLVGSTSTTETTTIVPSGATYTGKTTTDRPVWDGEEHDGQF